MAEAGFRERVIRGLVRRRLKEITFPKITDAIQGGSAKAKSEILAAFREGRGKEAGNAIMHLIMNLVVVEATAEADTMLADNQLSIADIERVFFNE